MQEFHHALQNEPRDENGGKSAWCAMQSRTCRDDSIIWERPSDTPRTTWRRCHSCMSQFPHLKETAKEKSTDLKSWSGERDDEVEPWEDELDFFESLDESAWQLLDETSTTTEKATSTKSAEAPFFQSAKGKRLVRPSAAAMEHAAKRLRLDDWNASPTELTSLQTPSSLSAAQPVSDIPQQTHGLFLPKSSPSLSTPPRPEFQSPLRSRISTSASKRPFRSPLRPITPQPKQISVGMSSRAYKSGVHGPTPNGRASFTPPFKKGVSPAGARAAPAQSVPAEEPSVFDLNKSEPRMSYREAGIVPRVALYNPNVPHEIRQILAHPPQAAQYAFTTNAGAIFGPSEALSSLQLLGAASATLKWVQNHWSLILWKLAAYVYWQPTLVGMWSFHSCLHQLRYRYEREMRYKHKSAIKRIQEHLTSSMRCMVLCVRQIRTYEEDGRGMLFLELTDGWYCIRAELDTPLREAVERGALRVGHKLAIMSAKLRSGGEPTPVLDALYTSDLQLYANSTTRARWDTKLGFHRNTFVSSLARLVPDGGIVGRIDVVVERVYPLGFMEGRLDARGVVQYGAEQYGEDEEAERQAAWDAQCAFAHAKVNERIARLNKAAAWLEAHVSGVHGADTADASTFVREIEHHSDPCAMLDSSTVSQAFLYAVLCAVQARLARLSDCKSEAYTTTLHEYCAPRHTRSFRIVRVREAQPTRRTSGRTVQLTIWRDTSAVAPPPAMLAEGTRYTVTHLVPTQMRAWRPPVCVADAFLSTTRDTQWQVRAAGSPSGCGC